MFSVPQAKVTSFLAWDFFKKEIDEKEGTEEKEVDTKVDSEENMLKTTGNEAEQASQLKNKRSTKWHALEDCIVDELKKW